MPHIWTWQKISELFIIWTNTNFVNGSIQPHIRIISCVCCIVTSAMFPVPSQFPPPLRLFEDLKIYTAEETEARQEVMYDSRPRVFGGFSPDGVGKRLVRAFVQSVGPGGKIPGVCSKATDFIFCIQRVLGVKYINLRKIKALDSLDLELFGKQWWNLNIWLSISISLFERFEDVIDEIWYSSSNHGLMDKGSTDEWLPWHGHFALN